MAANIDEPETWPLEDMMYRDSTGMPTMLDAWGFSMEASPDPASIISGLDDFRQDSDPGVGIFGKSQMSSKADRAAASKSLEELMLHDRRLVVAASPKSTSELSSQSSSSVRKRVAPLEASSSLSKKSNSFMRSTQIDQFHSDVSASNSLGSFGSSSSSAESSYAILSSVSPPLPRNLSLLSDEQRAVLQGIVASRRQFLSKNRKSKLDQLYGQNLSSEEEILSHVIRTYISKIPRNHSRLQLDQSTQALRHFIEMQLCIPFENFLITDAKLPGTVAIIALFSHIHTYLPCVFIIF
jgi:hypothetical protein